MSTLAEFTKGELLKLVTQDWVGKVTVGITEAIELSFQTDQVLRSVKTQSEISHRFNICIRWFVTLRRELGWTVPRILDEMPGILRGELDGVRFEPDEDRKAWHGETCLEDLVEDGEDLVGALKDIVGTEAEGIAE